MQADLGFDIGEFTFAEAFQMWTESEHAKWQHTASVIAKIEQVNSKNGKARDPSKLNPWDASSQTSTSSTFNITHDRTPLKALDRRGQNT